MVRLPDDVDYLTSAKVKFTDNHMWQAGQPIWFMFTSPAMIIAITKHKKSRETKLSNWEKTLSLP